MKHPDQRVGVFVDVQNMYHSAKNLYNSRVKFNEILKEAAAGRKLIHSVAYVIESKSKEEQKFFEALSKQGFELKIKALQVYPSGFKKADWDVGLVIDAIKMAPQLDVVVLVSGDGDFVPAVEYLQYHGNKVEVMAFGKTSSGKLKEVADEFIDLEWDKQRFLQRIK